jgi:hypothetical protein
MRRFTTPPPPKPTVDTFKGIGLKLQSELRELIRRLRDAEKPKPKK